MKKLILASKSPYRKELLSKLGLPFECVNSQVNEDELKKIYRNPTELTQKLAIAKALTVQENFQDAVIIGSDQVCHLDGKIMGKAGSLEKCLEQLLELRGKTHELVTSYCIIDRDRQIVRTNSTKLRMRKLSESQLKKYLSLDKPIDCAGSYKLELNGIGLMESIETIDYTAIIGIPIMEIASDLESLGFSLFSQPGG